MRDKREKDGGQNGTFEKYGTILETLFYEDE